MGDRYYLKLKCAWCKKLNEHRDQSGFGMDGIYYAPSSGATGFKCEHCGKRNEIVESFIAVKDERQ